MRRRGGGGRERTSEREYFDLELAICRVDDHVGDNSRINTIQWSKVYVEQYDCLISRMVLHGLT